MGLTVLFLGMWGQVAALSLEQNETAKTDCLISGLDCLISGLDRLISGRDCLIWGQVAALSLEQSSERERAKE